ncbi:hypothetical protein H920_00093 [Fukomys damarensis]|uniref:Uncharacterized protein n=1 Tax=Fukomys damarensis TaxID=885580 RepID=A0A091E238_FUKDA|nr:hypothetical protein H920_00093 [Fukomys damarensis]
MAAQSRMRKSAEDQSAHRRPKDPVEGLELAAAYCEGLLSEDRWVCDGRLEATPEAEESAPEAEGSVQEARRRHSR